MEMLDKAEAAGAALDDPTLLELVDQVSPEYASLPLSEAVIASSNPRELSRALGCSKLDLNDAQIARDAAGDRHQEAQDESAAIGIPTARLAETDKEWRDADINYKNLSQDSTRKMEGELRKTIRRQALPGRLKAAIVCAVVATGVSSGYVTSQEPHHPSIAAKANYRHEEGDDVEAVTLGSALAGYIVSGAFKTRLARRRIRQQAKKLS